MSENEMNKKEAQEAGRVSIKQRRKQENGGAAAAAMQENKKMLMLFGGIVAALAVILIGILVLDLPVVPVCVVVLIEAGLAVCFNNVPIWLHVLVMAAQIALGVLCGNLVFMVLAAVLYLIAILVL